MLIAAFFLLSGGFLEVCGFDWQPKPNQELRNQLIEYIEGAKKNNRDKKLDADLNQFLVQLKKEKGNSVVWLKSTHDLVAKLLQKYPPEPRYASQREIILRILDYPLHFDDLSKSTPAADKEAYISATLQAFSKAKDAMMQEIKTTKVKPGSVAIWNPYNMGFIMKTSKRTVGIDVITSRPMYYYNRKIQSVWEDQDKKDLAKLLDVLFVTHLHGDHYDGALANEMQRAGKSVVLPASIRLSFGPASQKKDSKKQQNQIILDQAVTSPRTIAGVQVLSFPGNQGENTPCNVYLLDFDGIRVVHAGDNYDHALEARIKEYEAANIIIGAAWNSIQEFTRHAINAKNATKRKQVLLPSHNNEMMHTVNHRESFWELYTGGGRIGNPHFPFPTIIVLAWGEGFFYPEMKAISNKRALPIAGSPVK